MTTEDPEHKVIKALVEYCENNQLPKPFSFHIQYPYGNFTNHKYVGIVKEKTAIDLDYDLSCILCGEIFRVRDPNRDIYGISPCIGVVAELVGDSVSEVTYGPVCIAHTRKGTRHMGHYEKIEYYL